MLLGREPGSAGANAASTRSDMQLFIADVDSGEVNPIGSSATGGKLSVSGKGQSPSSTPIQARDARFATDGHGIVMLTKQPAPAAAAANASAFARLVYLDLHNEQWRDLSISGSHEVLESPRALTVITSRTRCRRMARTD